MLETATSLMVYLSRRGEPTTNGRAVVEHFKKETRTFGRRATAAPHQDLQKNERPSTTLAEGTQRCGLQRPHFAGGGMRPHASSTRRSGLDFSLGGIVAACSISILHQRSYFMHTSIIIFLKRVAVEAVRLVARASHHRIGHFHTLDQFVELFFCIHDLVSIVTDDKRRSGPFVSWQQ